MEASTSGSSEKCCICFKTVASNKIEEHTNQCFEAQAIKMQNSPCTKKRQNQIGCSDKNFDIFNQPKKLKVELKQTERNVREDANEENDCLIIETIEKPNKKTPKPILCQPLADKIRPCDFDSYFGQQQAVGEKSIIRNLLKNDVISSMIFWGPPGCGKTTLAHIIFNHCNQHKESYRFVKMSACASGVQEVKEAIKQAKSYKDTFKRQTILFMDEIHRFNKLQQDTFLPFIENGTIILLGATTENPSFSLNNALLSRCRVIVLEKLQTDDMMNILRRALKNFSAIEASESNTSNADEIAESLDFTPKITIAGNCLRWIAEHSDGDARIALNSLEMCLKQIDEKESEGIRVITLEDVRDNIKKTHLLYDRAGDQHYDTISALHKSIRASDENASLYWVTRMMESGEDPRFICRRLIRAASEDIGLADPQSLILATSTMHAVEKIGMPESDCILAQLAVYLARAPKSTESYFAMLKCKEHIKNYEGPLPSVPLHLRNAPTKLMQQLGYARDYNRLNKDESGLNYLPEEIEDVNFFE